jgi:hypothetical protein
MKYIIFVACILVAGAAQAQASQLLLWNAFRDFREQQKQASNNAGACYSIANADSRAMCLAVEHRDPGRCYSIADPDTRALCRAKVK